VEQVYACHVRLIHCHHSMARPRVADGKTTKVDYIELAAADKRQGVVFELGCWAWG
jgi:hypothetical protein